MQAAHHARQVAPRRGNDALCGDLHRQRQPAQQAAQRLGRRSIGGDRLRAEKLHQQFDAFLRREFAQVDDLGRMQGDFGAVTRCDEHGAGGCARQQQVNRPAGHDVVEHDQRAFVGEQAAHCGGACGRAGDLAEVTVIGHCPALQDVHRFVGGDASPQDAVGECAAQVIGHRCGQRRLADPTHAHYGDDGRAAGLREHGDHARHFLAAANEMARRCDGLEGGWARRFRRRRHPIEIARQDTVVEGVGFGRGWNAQFVHERRCALVVLLERSGALAVERQHAHLEPVHFFALGFFCQQACTGVDAHVEHAAFVGAGRREPVENLAKLSLEAIAFAAQPFHEERRAILQHGVDAVEQRPGIGTVSGVQLLQRGRRRAGDGGEALNIGPAAIQVQSDTAIGIDEILALEVAEQVQLAAQVGTGFLLGPVRPEEAGQPFACDRFAQDGQIVEDGARLDAVARADDERVVSQQDLWRSK